MELGLNVVELISIHIPKTAGTSFRNILKEVYGPKNVERVDIPIPGERAAHELRVNGPSKLPGNLKVIHGHFRHQDLVSHYGLDSGIPVITWLRDPVERVLSNYFYLQKILREIVREENRSVAILNKMEKTLLEYARADIARDRMSRFLEGLDLKQLRFVGIQEYFEEDIRDLAEGLGWKKYPVLRQNDSGDRRVTVPTEIRRRIERLNPRDTELYREALAMRWERKQPLEGAVCRD